MSINKNSPQKDKAPSYAAIHWLVLGITCLFGSVSAMALFYHVWTAGHFTDEAFRLPFAGVGAAIAFFMAIMPAAFAKAHGEAITGASAQSSILMVVLLIMIVDGALQWHAVTIFMEIIEAGALSWWKMALIIGSIQISLFASRGALAASTSEQAELLASQRERAEMIASRERIEMARIEQDNAKREAKNAKQRERRAAKKAAKAEAVKNVISLRN